MTMIHPNPNAGRHGTTDVARTRLWWSAVVFLVAFGVHTADHLRRGAESISSALYVAGTISSAITVAGITIVLTRHRLAPAVAVAVGFPQALAFLAAHFVPHWSSVSDSFVDEHVIWFSWFAASAEVLGATLFGVAGLLVLRREGPAAIVGNPPADAVERTARS